ncbi:MAG: HAD hydrolase-like protein [Bacillota bacterium]|nr:HAD hydrolase-like protein [Bacillota bacterium]
MAKKFLLFDLDGTLVKTTAGFYQTYFQLIARAWTATPAASFLASLLAATEEVRRQGEHRRPVGEVILADLARRENLSLSQVEAFFREFYGQAYETLAPFVEPIPGLPEAVAAFHREGIPMGVASDPVFPQEQLALRLAWGGLDPSLFRLITGADNSYALKPHARYYEDACRQAGFSPEETLYVGNDPARDGLALRAGLQTFIVVGEDHPIAGRGPLLPEEEETSLQVPTGSWREAVAWVRQGLALTGPL